MEKITYNQISPARVRHMQILRANGCTYATIAELLDCSMTTARKYCKKVAILPKNRQRDPFKMLTPAQAEIVLESRLPTVDNIRIAEEIGDLDYYLENYEIGTPFKGPLDKTNLRELQALMSEPTNYQSPLSMVDWAEHYLEGRSGGILLHKPHLWSNQQHRMMTCWETHKRVMFETFRDAGKTMAGTAINTHEICEHRDSNYAMMSESKAKAKKRVKQIGDILLTNKRIIADYGFLPHMTKYEGHTQSWTREEITVKRDFKQTDPTLMSFSSESTEATGAHFAGITFDDVWSAKLEKNSRSNKDKWLTWYDGELEGCLENAWELWLLTRKGPTDLYQDIEDRNFYVIFKEPAIQKYPEDWEIIWKTVNNRKVFDHIQVNSKDGIITDNGHGRFSMEFFLEKKSKMDAVKFESEYQLNPLASKGKFWDRNNLRWINGYYEYFDKVEERHWDRRFKIIGAIDPAFGQSARADYTSLAIIGSYEKKIYLLECYIKRKATTNDVVDMIRKAKQTFPLMSEIFVEADLQQTAYYEQIKKKASFIAIKPILSRQEQALLYKNDSAVRDDLKNKPLRIWSQLEGIIEDNMFYVNKSMQAIKEFNDEFNTFPSCSHFDVLDSVGMGVSKIHKKAALIFALSGGT